MDTSIATRIKTLRKAKKLTQKALGAKVGVGGSSVSQWESGDTEPTGQNLISLAKILGSTPRWIIDGELEKGQEATEVGYPILDSNHIEDWLGGDLREPEGEYISSTKNQLKNERTFVWRVTDSAMGSIVPQGWLVYVNPDFKIPPGNHGNVDIIALIERDGRYALRLEFDDMGEIVYRAVTGNYRQLSSSECNLIGYVVGMAERTLYSGPDDT